MRRLVLSLIVAAASAVPARAQGMLEAERQRNLSDARVSTADPDITSPYALPIPSVTLETAKGDARAKATIGFARNETTYRFTFASPIGDAADAEANPLSLTGLGNDATAEFALSHLFLFKRYTDRQLLEFCTAHGVEPGRCSDQAFATGQLRRQFIGLALHRRPSLVTVSGQIGAPSYTYLDPVSLESIDEKKTSHKVSASYALLFLPDNLVAAHLTHSRSYSAGKDDTTICRPLADTSVAGATRCDDAILGAPTFKDVWAMTLEWRRQIVAGSAPIFGISAQLHVDLADASRVAVEVPIYFLQKKPDRDSGPSLNGGVNAGWSAEHGFVARVFIGAGFKLLTPD